MAGTWIYYLHAIALLLIAVTAETPEQYHVSMDEDSNYRMHWSFNNQDKIMQFTVEVKTTGWIGFGISPYTGQMPGSDVVIGWVDSNGKAYLQDRFANGRTLPALDDNQDYKLISGIEKNGMTTLKFSRKFNTEDPKDLPLEGGTTRLIWAYNNNDPPSQTNIPMHHKMGSRSVNLFNAMPEIDKPKLPDDTKTYDCLAPNVTVPSKHTSYWCVGLKLPQVTEKHHIIKLDPVITKGNEGVVHHMTLFECESDPKWHGYAAECDSQNMPNHLRNCRSGSAMAGWAVGGESITFPAKAGFPIGGKNNPKFAVIEMHYDNPEGKSNIVDSSGYKIYYTKQLRPNDIGVLIMGHLVSPFLIVPNNQMQWNITGYCSGECTSMIFPKNGINIFALFFHTHLAGVALDSRQFRNGKELPLVAENKHYDFNYQELYYMKDEVNMMPGDTMSVTCVYKTKNRTKLTLGGLSTKEEMCLNYVFYYPKIDLSACSTQPAYEALGPYLAKLWRKGILPIPSQNGSAGLYESLGAASLDDPKLIQELANVQTYPPPAMYCAYGNRTMLFDRFGVRMANFKSVANYTMENTTNGGFSISTFSSVMTLAHIVVAFYYLS
ncbi:uncharacterized protein TRIADDRAFT_55459 [Trichoplax adhaerens]|uniref:DOMON domain-containing protein n=1 Tax=Trichoplax adhaerens TaxID=10228 RepID=B3RUY6_TRIAD|nr:hypothetical protein TRIADDRAFT_55459 [Trichoplax adhaerens]EDV25400.1 hypothetical protein TRIADDRAFT_55459 [Trichoplax adhaerens]|eukprot:XP_002111433.1 hypothetical protein TRIADDRAFT_55459 [Trichoplax adhaerens]